MSGHGRTNFIRIRLQLDAVASSMSAAKKCWLLVNVSQSQRIADLMHIISHRFRVTNNCSLYLDDYWLPPGESTMVLKDNDIIRVVSSERADNLNYHKKLRVTSSSSSSGSSNSSSSGSSSSSADDDDVQITQRVDKTLTYSKILPNLNGNTTVLQSGASHTVFDDSDAEHQNNENITSTNVSLTYNFPPEIPPECEPERSIEVNNTVSRNTAKNRRRRNRKKARKFEQMQKSVGGEDDVLVAVSKIFQNPTDGEGCLEINKPNEAEVLINNDSCNVQENQSKVENENTGDDFGVDFTADFDTYPELNGTPRVGDVLVYKELEMSTTYTPEISTYKVCKVVGLNSNTRTIEVKLSWTTYKAECVKVEESKKRKFEFDNATSEEVTTLVEKELELELDRLCIIRLVPAT